MVLFIYLRVSFDASRKKQVSWHFQVDKHIRRLDADLARFENDLQEKLDMGSMDSSDEKQLRS